MPTPCPTCRRVRGTNGAAAIVAGLGTVVAWIGTGSWLRAVLAFGVGTGVSVFAILRLAPKGGG
jgi:hypothetical protein